MEHSFADWVGKGCCNDTEHRHLCRQQHPTPITIDRMTIYYTMTFMLLAAEMAMFCVIAAPLPYPVRKRMLHFLSESPLIGKVAYGLKISFIFVGILFVDALQRMFRITAESDMAKHGGQMPDVRTESNMAARKFYAQRNVYLTGFCLFLSLIITRIFYICLDLLHAQEEFAKLKQQSGKGASSESQKEITDLKKQIEVLKKQAGQNNAEYNRLADEYNTKTGSVSDKRKD